MMPERRAVLREVARAMGITAQAVMKQELGYSEKVWEARRCATCANRRLLTEGNRRRLQCVEVGLGETADADVREGSTCREWKGGCTGV